MARYDFSAPRLFVDTPLASGEAIELNRAQANYLVTVLRLKSGGDVLVFNGRDGEWRASLGIEGRRAATLTAREQVRQQTALSQTDYLFAPLKHARLDYLVQKAVEMGAGRLVPMLTQRTQVSRVNRERMRANAIEAAEQCGILSVPEILPETDFAAALAQLAPDCLIVFCDEEAPVADPVSALADAARPGAACALVIGPEGGFTEGERALLTARPSVIRISLGPRILRADTAAVAALALIQAVLGDWR